MTKIEMTPERIKEIVDLVKANPHIKQLHFTADGNYHVNAYPHTREGETESKLYSRVGLLHTAANKPEAILDEFEIVATVSRGDILAKDTEGQDGKADDHQPAGPVVTGAETKEPLKVPAPAATESEGASTEQTQN